MPHHAVFQVVPGLAEVAPRRAPSAVGSGIISAQGLLLECRDGVGPGLLALGLLGLAERRRNISASRRSNRSSAGGTTYSRLLRPGPSANSSSWRSQISRIYSWAVMIASAIRSSGISRAKPSIISTDSWLPETIRSRSLSSSWSWVGKGTNWPSM